MTPDNVVLANLVAIAHLDLPHFALVVLAVATETPALQEQATFTGGLALGIPAGMAVMAAVRTAAAAAVLVVMQDRVDTVVGTSTDALPEQQALVALVVAVEVLTGATTTLAPEMVAA